MTASSRVLGNVVLKQFQCCAYPWEGSCSGQISAEVASAHSCGTEVVGGVWVLIETVVRGMQHVF